LVEALALCAEGAGALAEEEGEVGAVEELGLLDVDGSEQEAGKPLGQ
jgi:hypothetical protein